ncbi:MAG: glucose-1-phosphate adenylyltransferase, partial [Clostridia bacterium]|nr:glucose-1-phosphate adenylyltransferase [Clostridia bacterium]
PNIPLDLNDESWKIYSSNPVVPPHYVSSTATVQNSLISDGCDISGSVDFSVLFNNVTVKAGAVVQDSIIMPGSVIEEGAVVQYAIVSENTVIGKNAVIGARPEDIEDKDNWGIAVIGDNLKIGANAKVAPKAMISKDIEEVE